MKETGKQISVLCVDDNPYVADALRIKISRTEGLSWAGWLSEANTLVEHVERNHPQVVILDIDMPGQDPFVALKKLAQQKFETRVVVFSGYVRAELVDRAIEAGVWGYVSKNDGEEALIDAIYKVAGGEFTLSTEARASSVV